MGRRSISSVLSHHILNSEIVDESDDELEPVRVPTLLHLLLTCECSSMRQLKRPSTHTIWRLGIQTQASQYMTGDKTSRSVKVKPLKFFADYMCL